VWSQADLSAQRDYSQRPLAGHQRHREHGPRIHLIRDFLQRRAESGALGSPALLHDRAACLPGGLDKQRAGPGKTEVPQVGDDHLAIRVPVRDRGGAQRSPLAGQERHAQVGQAGHRQRGRPAQQLVPVGGCGHQLAGPDQEAEPVLGELRLRPRGPLPGRRRGLVPQRLVQAMLLGDVTKYHIAAPRLPRLVGLVRHRGDLQPARLAGLRVRDADHLVGDHRAGAQCHLEGELARGELRAVLAHGVSGGRQRPREHVGGRHSHDLTSRWVGLQDQPVGGIADDAERERLEQRPVAIPDRRQLPGQFLPAALIRIPLVRHG